MYVCIMILHTGFHLWNMTRTSWIRALALLYVVLEILQENCLIRLFYTLQQLLRPDWRFLLARNGYVVQFVILYEAWSKNQNQYVYNDSIWMFYILVWIAIYYIFTTIIINIFTFMFTPPVCPYSVQAYII